MTRSLLALLLLACSQPYAGPDATPGDVAELAKMTCSYARHCTAATPTDADCLATAEQCETPAEALGCYLEAESQCDLVAPCLESVGCSNAWRGNVDSPER